MKTDISAVGTPSLWPQLRHTTRRVGSFCTSCASSVCNGLANFGTKLQLGRMESVLRRMSDEELAQIGITQSEIERHAKFLVSYEYDSL